MALSSDEKWILVAVLAVVGMFVIYFEVRYMRGKSKEVRRASQRKDEAYNAILTTRSVINVMQRRGADTSKSEALVGTARMAMDRGDYSRCMNLCEQARDELTAPLKAGSAPAPKSPSGTPGPSESLEDVAEDILSASRGPGPADNYTGSKLAVDKDGNYMSAKFEINTAKADIQSAISSGSDTSEAQGLLTDAEGAFVAGNYTRALSLAVRARKAVSKEAAGETIRLRAAKSDEDTSEPTPDEASGPEPGACGSCGAPLEPGDSFCGKCGGRIQTERVCSNCGAKARPVDKYCRRCGSSLD